MAVAAATTGFGGGLRGGLLDEERCRVVCLYLGFGIEGWAVQTDRFDDAKKAKAR